MAHIYTVPNQLVVKVKKDQFNENDNYMKVNIDTLERAAQDLKAGAFKLWIYFAKNQNNYTFSLSPQHIKSVFGINKTQYNSAKKELIDKGYLVVQDRLFYHFNETPLNEEEDTEVE